MSLAGLLVLLAAAPVAEATDSSEVVDNKECRHGYWDKKDQHCKCYEGWATAGITDTMDFIEGVCEQFRCKSDSQCQEVLGIAGATCPVEGWNCYCGWAYAFHNFGHGYETAARHGGGECMGIMYTFSVWATESLGRAMAWMWRPFCIVALVLLPFGRKRSICDHQWPSLWNGMRHVVGCSPACHGACVMNASYTMDTFKDDVAWSIYVLDVAVWAYLFMGTLYVISMLIWSFILWVLVLVMLVVALIAALCMSCGEGLAACGNCDCCNGCCGGGDCAGGGTSADCCDCFMLGAHHPGGMTADAFYWNGPFPYDPCWGYTGYGNLSVPSGGDCNCCCDWNCCTSICRPLAWLLFVFPVLPENAWGGFCGYWFFGTHHHTPANRLYQGGNPVVELMRMGWRRRADLHSNESWRVQVYNFLSGDGAAAAGGESDARPTGSFNRRFTSMFNESEANVVDGQTVLTIGRAHAILTERPFSLQEDHCVPSSFEDYVENKCWICQSENEEWDLWLSCHHLYCKDCSSEMLRRRMPCPLCRVASSTVLRGKAHPELPVTGQGLGSATPPTGTLLYNAASSVIDRKANYERIPEQ